MWIPWTWITVLTYFKMGVRGKGKVKRKKSSFQPGHPWFRRKEGEKEEGNEREKINEEERRGEREISDINTGGEEAVREAHVNMKRPDIELFQLAVNPDEVVLPSVLRPKHSTKTSIPTARVENITGNRIFNIPKLENAINSFLSIHYVVTPKCNPQIHFAPEGEVCRGLCLQEQIMCTRCNFTADREKLYEEVDEKVKRRGPRTGKLNLQLQIALSKLPIKNAGAQFLFAALDIPPPSKAAMQQLANYTADSCQNINVKEMEISRSTVRQILQLKGNDVQPGVAEPIPVQLDTAYNNPVRGRTFSQPGTQAVCPMVENVTNKRMVIGLQIASKMCQKCEHLRLKGEGTKLHAGVCTANFCEGDPIGNSERMLSREVTREVLSSEPLKPSIICTDNDGKSFQGVLDGLREMKINSENVEKQDCTVHNARGQRRKVMNTEFSNAMLSSMRTTPGRPLECVKRSLAHAITQRCTGELLAARKNIPEDQTVSHLNNTANNILRCFTGDHKQCKESSLVCLAAKKRNYKPSHLPSAKYITNMTEDDKVALKTCIHYRLGPTAVIRQRHGMNTNRVESLHNKCNKSCPKSHLTKRNFAGYIHSAVHSSTLGTGESTLKMNKVLGAPHCYGGPAMNFMDKLSKQEKYHLLRQRSEKFKRRKKILRSSRLNRKVASKLGYQTDLVHPSVQDDHSYNEHFTA